MEENGTEQVVPADGETTPPATEIPSENQPQVAPEAGEQTPPAPEKEPVPYDRFKEVNDAKKVAEERIQLYEDQLRLNQVQAPQQPAERDLAAELGMSQDDLYAEGGVNKFLGAVDQMVNQKLTQASQAMQTQQFFNSHPDYNELVGTSAGQTFIPSETWKDIRRTNPQLARTIESSPDAPMLAYEYAKNHKSVQPTNQQQIINAANNLAPVAPVRPSITQAVGTGQLDKISAIRQMSDADFEAHKAEIKAKGGF